MMRNSYISETRLIDAAISDIGTRLPPRWLLRDRGRGAAARFPHQSARVINAIWELRDSEGLSADIIVEARADPVEPRLVGSLAARLGTPSLSRQEQAGAARAGLLVSTYLSPLARERLAQAGMGYADSTGNIRFAVDRPAVYVETHGADRNPFRQQRPLQSLRRGRAARVARGLLDYRPPFGTRELAGEAACSAAMVSGLLEPDEIVTREGPRGRIVSVDWEALTRRWAADYEFASSNTLTTWLEPRGEGRCWPGFAERRSGTRSPARLRRIAWRRLRSLAWRRSTWMTPRPEPMSSSRAHSTPWRSSAPNTATTSRTHASPRSCWTS